MRPRGARQPGRRAAGHAAGAGRGEWGAAPALLGAAAALFAVALALWVHRRVLGGFFALDDLILLEQMRGLRPLIVTPWRFLSGPAYFAITTRLFGTHPLPYHLVSWVLHGLDVALLYLLARRWGGGVPAALLAAGLFGTTRLAMTALAAATSIGEVLALGLTLGALLAAGRGLARGLWSGLLMVAALLCKESVALVPLVLLLPRPAAGPLRARARQAAPAVLAGLLLLLPLVLAGTASGRLQGEAYEMRFGGLLFHNLMTFASWSVDLLRAIPDQLALPSEEAWRAGLWLPLLLAVIAFAARRLTALPAAGLLWWLLALAPVAPLTRHTYLHYLYVPLAGLALAAAGVVEWGIGRVAATGSARLEDERGARTASAPRAEWRWGVGGFSALAVAAIVLAHAAWSDRLLAERYRVTVSGQDIPLDPFLRKCEMARRASESVAATLGGRHGSVAIAIPEGSIRTFNLTTGQEVPKDAPAAASYNLTEGALDGGRGLRALQPGVDSVVFLGRFTPGYETFEFFLIEPDGRLAHCGHPPQAHVRVGAVLLNNNLDRSARDWLAGAVAAWPDEADLRYEYALSLARLGDLAAGLAQLEELIRRSPNAPRAEEARTILSQNRRPQRARS